MFSFRFLLAFLVNASGAASQELKITPDLRFENFNAERHFTSEYVGNITVDTKGYLWAASNGLFRYDGVRLQYYANFNNQYHGLRDNYSDDLVADPWGRLWIGNGSGLCYFNDTLDKFQYLNKDSATPIHYAYSFLLAGNEMWFVCNLGLCRINLQTFVISETSLKEFADPIEIFPLGDQLLGISTRTGLYLYDKKKNDWRKKIFTYEGTTIRIRQCVTSAGIYWLGTNKGLWKLDLNTENVSPVEGSFQLNISDMAFHPLDKEKAFLWMSTTNNGLQLFNTRSNKIEHSFIHDDTNPYSLASNNITSLHFDNMQRLWMGTERGASMFDYRNQFWKIRQLNFLEGITADNLIRKTVQDNTEKDRVWMSCINQGIVLVDWKNKKILQHYKNFPAELSLSFHDMHQLPNHTWVLLGKNKLIEWDPATELTGSIVSFPELSSLPANPEFTSILKTETDDLYITSNVGLFVYHPATLILEPVLKREGPDLYSSYDFQQAVLDKNGIVWLASRKGLVKYDPHQKHVQVFYYHSPDSIPANFLSQVAVSDNGFVVCASGLGVGLFDISKESFTRVSEFGNIRNPACYGIFIQKQRALLNSTAGLLQIDLNSFKTSVIDIPENTDIYSPVPFCHVNNDLVMGYRNKYVYFNPQYLVKTELPTSPRIERILLNNAPFYNIPSDDKEYHFNHTQNSFSFSFTSFEFNNPGAIRFRYMLEGHDREWTYLDEQRNATYIRLPPGHYTFKLQAGNKQDTWNEQVAVFHFYIIPPFWQRWWFWPLVGLVFVTVVVWIARRRINIIRKREEEKTAINKSMAELQTKLLRSQMNPHFIFNSLNSIQKYIWENKEEDAAEYLANFAKLIRAILENSGKDFIPLKDEIAIVKLYIELEHRRSNGRFNYSIKVAEDIDPVNTGIPPMILQPFIENAIWHGLSTKEGKGNLVVSISKENEYLVCIVDDDGVGRKEHKELNHDKQSMGIDITRQRIEKLMQNSGRQLAVTITDKMDNGKPAGTKVTITLPLQTV